MKVCLSRPCAPNEIIDIELFPDITIEEFSKIVKLPNKNFSIKTPFYREKLNNSIQPFIIFPELVSKDNEILRYPIPDTCLMINEISHPEYSLFVMISTQLENIEFPKMEVEIKSVDLEKWFAKDFLSKCIETFSYSCNNALLLNYKQEKIDENIPMKELYDISKKSHLIFHCEIDESCIEKINKRKHIVEEIIQSEITYIKNIETLDSYFYPAFQNSEIFDRFQLKVIFREIKPIIQTHLELICKESKIKPAYKSEVGPIFLNFIDRFKVAIPFVINYKHVDDMIQKKRLSSKHNEKKYLEISSRNPNQEGGDFMSYYIMPVQRYPRYTLLIRDLDKYTPSFHPDKPYLTLAIESLIMANREIDSTTQQVKQLLILGEIQKALPNTVTVISSDRTLIMKKKVILHQKVTIKRGLFYLFNDMILITKIKKGNKKLKPILFTKIENFLFYNSFPQNDSIFINSKETEITVTFENYEDRKSFIEQLNITRTIHLSTIKCDSKFIKWTEVELGSTLIPLMNHDGCLMNKKVYFFGGTNSSLMNCSALIVHDLVTNKWKLQSSPVQSRIGHTMTTVFDKVYICFGYNKNEYFSDIWEYDGNRWKIIVLSTKIEVAYHSTVCYDNKLVVFGGINKNGCYSNSMYSIDPISGDVKLIESNNPPCCRSNHSAVIVNNKMIIIGGETNLFGYRILGEVHVFDFKQNTWAWMSNADVQPRINHRAIALKGFVFVIGGCSNKLKAKNDHADGRSNSMFVIQNECIDPLLWKKIEFKEFGNSPLGLSNFAISPTSKTSAITFGGIDYSTKLPFASSWTFDIEEGFFQT